MLNNVITGVFSVLLFAFTVFLSVRTLFNSINARKYVIYRDKITIESTTFKGEIDLSKVFMVKSKRNLIDVLFKNDAHTIYIYVKNDGKDFYMLPFIGEDSNLLVDEILKLAIAARENKKYHILNDFENNEKSKKIEQDNLVVKKIKNAKKKEKSDKNM